MQAPQQLKMRRTYIVQAFMQFGTAVTGIELEYAGNKLEANSVYGSIMDQLAKEPRERTGLFMRDHDKGRVCIPGEALRAVFMIYRDEPDMGSELPGIPGSMRLG